jgi:predicted nucleic acid-binding protein
MAQTAKRGIVLPLGDTLIAATALGHDLIVVTQNLKHFQPTGVKVLDPLS